MKGKNMLSAVNCNYSPNFGMLKNEDKSEVKTVLNEAKKTQRLCYANSGLYAFNAASFLAFAEPKVGFLFGICSAIASIGSFIVGKNIGKIKNVLK